MRVGGVFRAKTCTAVQTYVRVLPPGTREFQNIEQAEEEGHIRIEKREILEHEVVVEATLPYGTVLMVREKVILEGGVSHWYVGYYLVDAEEGIVPLLHRKQRWQRKMIVDVVQLPDNRKLVVRGNQVLALS